MTKRNIAVLSLFAALALSLPAFGQAILTNTTLSAAITTGNARTIQLTSATGVTAPVNSNPSTYTFLYVDRELLDVQSVTGTNITVIRGAEGTQAVPHASSAVVFVIPAYIATYLGGGAPGQGPAVPAGSCTRANELVLPRIQFASGLISDCNGGQWITGDALSTTRAVHSGYRFPDPGGTALTALETAGTAPAANTEQYCSEIDLYYSTLVTGLGVLNGTTVGTDKHIVILYDSSGNVLANSATAGATTAGASTYQKMNFVTKYWSVGPGRYFGCVQSNGTTDTIRHAITAVNDNILGGTITTQVFGTVKAITAPTTFTTAKVPYFLVY